MKLKIFNVLLGLIAILFFSACNKDVEQFPDIVLPGTNPSSGLATALASNANYSLYNAIVIKSGMSATLNDSARTMTMFVPSNAAVKQAISLLTSGQVPVNASDAVFLGFINGANFTQETAAGIVAYNLVPQKIDYAAIPTTLPNFQYPSFLNPAPQLSALLRLTTFPSKTNGNFVNNVPVTSAAMNAGNGVMYETGALVAPPRRYLWERISTDPGLSYLKAAIERADSGSVAGDPKSSLVAGLQSIGANLTVFAPSDAAFKATLYVLAFPSVRAYIFGQAKAAGAPDAVANAMADAQAPAQTTALVSSPTVFSNPLLFSSLTAERVKGVVVYHILASRAFLNNFPTTQTNYPTLLNGAVASHPGVGLKVTMTGPMAVSATVKGAVNGSAANITANPTPEPGGTSDQHYLNGVIHKIDQVLLPMTF